MKRYFRLMFLSAMVTIMMGIMIGQAGYADNSGITQKDIDEGIAFCKDYPVSLQVDGAIVESDVDPVIIKERTLIPVRAVFESMGANVSWDEDARLVEIEMGTSDVRLTIDSNTAFVNGEQKDMDVPALIIDDRTMIPVRFVGESLSAGIGWNDVSRTVIVTSPAITEVTSIESIEVREKPDYYRVIIEGDRVFSGYRSFAYDSPDRFGIDIQDAVLNMDVSSIESDQDNQIFNLIRFAQFKPDTVRIVADLDQKVAGKVSFSADKNSLYIDFNKEQVEDYENLGDVTEDGLDVVDWRATQKLVVIDPGHGGRDTGAQAIRDGVEILNEKDVNIDVALRLNQMLKAAGVSTYILRETDTTITLYDRPALANAANADLYIAIHNNSSENPDAKGTEVYYNSKANELEYGIYSKQLAETVFAEFPGTVGTNGRKIKNEPAYAVLNKTSMPAIIIEGAFLSNDDDLKLMMTDEFRQNYALATAKGVIKILNESVEESGN